MLTNLAANLLSSLVRQSQRFLFRSGTGANDLDTAARTLQTAVLRPRSVAMLKAIRSR